MKFSPPKEKSAHRGWLSVQERLVTEAVKAGGGGGGGGP